MSLLVKTRLNVSSIPDAGIGCFADQFIPKGTKIWELNTAVDRIYTQQDYDRLTELEQKFVEIYAYKHHDLYFLCVDNARFFNHSKQNFNTLDPDTEYVTYAARDIQPGEEILSNYENFGTNESDKSFNTKGFYI